MMNTETVIIIGLIVGGIVAFLFLYQRNFDRLADPDLKRITELENELAQLYTKVENLERLNDLVISQNGELARKLERSMQDYQVVDSENRALRRRMSEMGLRE